MRRAGWGTREVPRDPRWAFVARLVLLTKSEIFIRSRTFAPIRENLYVPDEPEKTTSSQPPNFSYRVHLFSRAEGDTHETIEKNRPRARYDTRDARRIGPARARSFEAEPYLGKVRKRRGHSFLDAVDETRARVHARRDETHV